MLFKPLPQFEVSATKHFSLTEVGTLLERIEANPQCGRAVWGTVGTIRRIRHPHVLRQSERGFHPVAVYIINQTENEIILVDVIDGLDELKEMMRDPRAWAKAMGVSRLLQKIWENLP